MSDKDTAARLAAVEVLVLSELSNQELATFNNAIQWLDHLPKNNSAFGRAVEMKLVKENGYPWDLETLRTASAFEVNRRVEAGTFH